MVTLLKIRSVRLAPPMASDSSSPVMLNDFHCQSQKLIRQMCCLCARITREKISRLFCSARVQHFQNDLFNLRHFSVTRRTQAIHVILEPDGRYLQLAVNCGYLISCPLVIQIISVSAIPRRHISEVQTSFHIMVKVLHLFHVMICHTI